ncbi:MAG: hypothetical protein LAP85_16070 [Acidobacteriia bacterium]|nr:hypothetical protein [Terriglobia bacterium]
MYDDDLTLLDESIRRLKVEYDIFFVGNRKRAPDDLRMRVEKLVKRLAEAVDMSFSQRFRYNTLIARFYVYRDLWRRTQQERESAEGLQDVPGPSSSSDTQADSSHRRVQISISDPKAEADKVRHLYDELLRMRGDHTKESPSISYQQFASYIANQTQGIKKKYQCASVTFRIALEEKTLKFTAKADNSASG